LLEEVTGTKDWRYGGKADAWRETIFGAEGWVARGKEKVVIYTCLARN